MQGVEFRGDNLRYGTFSMGLSIYLPRNYKPCLSSSSPVFRPFRGTMCVVTKSHEP